MSVTLECVTQTMDGISTIRDVSLTLERGTLSVLLGPTLSGKTSIMRLLAGLDKPATGRVLVDGKDVTGADVRQRSVAMVYQQFINYPSLTVYENIASPLRVQGKPRAEIEKRVAEAAKLLRLEPFLKRTPLQLSGGQQQRTAIARALVKGADLVASRAHQLEIANGQAGRHAFPATVTVTEITGSESFVHLHRDSSDWVAVLHGVHEYEPGRQLDAVLDPDNVFVFDAAGRLVAAPKSS